MAGREEAADDTADMLSYAEIIGIVNAVALHAQAETAYAVKDYRLTLGKAVVEHLFHLGYHCHDIALAERTVAACFYCKVFQRQFTLAHRLSEIFSVATAALYVVLYESNLD